MGGLQKRFLNEVAKEILRARVIEAVAGSNAKNDQDAVQIIRLAEIGAVNAAIGGVPANSEGHVRRGVRNLGLNLDHHVVHAAAVLNARPDVDKVRIGRMLAKVRPHHCKGQLPTLANDSITCKHTLKEAVVRKHHKAALVRVHALSSISSGRRSRLSRSLSPHASLRAGVLCSCWKGRHGRSRQW